MLWVGYLSVHSHPPTSSRLGCRGRPFASQHAPSSSLIVQMIGSIIAFSVIVEYRGPTQYNYIVSWRRCG